MFPVSRRELLGRTVLGVQILLLAACGGDDEDEAEQPRAAPTAPQASVPKLAREPVTLRLASGSRSVCRRRRKDHQAME